MRIQRAGAQAGARCQRESDVIAAVDRQLERLVVAVPMVVASSCRHAFDEEFRQLATMTKLFPTIFWLSRPFCSMSCSLA